MTPPLRARTVALPDPGPLERLLPDDGLIFVRRGEGHVAWGEAASFAGGTAAEARTWWTEFVAGLELESEIGLPAHLGPTAFVSLPFDAEHSADRARLIVPAHVVTRIRRPDGQFEAWWTQIGHHLDDEPPRPLPDPPPPAGTALRGDAAARERYETAVRDAVTDIAAGALAKVVLARAVDVDAASTIAASWLVRRLVAAYPDCWVYLHDGLVGASPELLVRLDRGLVVSRVLAGTAGRSKQATLGLLAQLTDDGKDRREHSLAVDSAVEALRPLVGALITNETPYVLTLPNVLHLASDVGAVANPGVDALDLVAALHPTAAVGGVPRTAAMAAIARLESVDRGRYSGPVGWIDAAGDGTFAIALRCGQLSRDARSIRLFAGCGIVADSDAAAEYDESVAKLLPLTDALGVTG